MILMDTNAATHAWIQMFRAYRRAREQADSALKSNDLPPLEQYDILLELGRAGQAGLRPMELENLLRNAFPPPALVPPRLPVV